MRIHNHRQYVTNIYNSWFVYVFPFFSPFYLNFSLYCIFPLFPSSHINQISVVRQNIPSHSVIARQFHCWAACFLCWQCGVQFCAFGLKHLWFSLIKSTQILGQYCTVTDGSFFSFSFQFIFQSPFHPTLVKSAWQFLLREDQSGMQIIYWQ